MQRRPTGTQNLGALLVGNKKKSNKNIKSLFSMMYLLVIKHYGTFYWIRNGKFIPYFETIQICLFLNN
jgi:hypothetical protein